MAMTKSVWGDLLFLIGCFHTVNLFNNFILSEEPLSFVELYSFKNLPSSAVGIGIGLLLGHYFRKNRIKKRKTTTSL